MYVKDEYTTSLLHFDEGLKDDCGKLWSTSNGAGVSTANSKFGGSSLYLGGASSLTTPATIDFNPGTGDFTVDWWEYRTAAQGMAFSTNPGSVYTTMLLGYCAPGANRLTCSMSSNKSTWNVANNVSMGSLSLNTWNHFAVVRKGSTFYTFQNGILQSTWQSSLTFENADVSTSVIGTHWGYFFKGYIDEFRFSKGIARWTENFTPPVPENTPAPENLTANASDKSVTLFWGDVTGALGYNVKRSTTAGGPYTTIASNIAVSNYQDSNVVNGTTYYYVVTALGPNGESVNSNEASATPMAAGNGVLVVNMDDGRHEYDLSQVEISAFINWYDAKAAGTGANYYILNKSFNLGPFASRKDYLIFDQIINFEVMAYQG